MIIRITVVLGLITVFATAGFSAGTYILLDEDWEGTGYWGYTSPPSGWECWGDAPVDNDDWHGSTIYAPDGHAAVVSWTNAHTPSDDGLYTYPPLDFSAFTITPSEGDKLYLEFDHLLTWWGSGYTGTAAVSVYTDTGYHTLDSWNFGDDQNGHIYADLLNYADSSFCYVQFWLWMNDNFGIDGWGVDNIEVVFENYDPSEIKSASLGEIKALYRSE